MKSLGSVDATMLILDKNGEIWPWPWNDLEGEFAVAAKEVSLIPKDKWDMTKMYWNYVVQLKKQCSFWSKMIIVSCTEPKWFHHI